MSNVRDFGAVGDGMTDDTNALQHAIQDGNGVVEFPRGDYRITRSLVLDLTKTGRLAIQGAGGTAKLLMHGPGPALSLVATHASTADPSGFRPEEWQRERMPTVSGIEIEGRHPEADGIRIVGVMQPTLTGLLIRQVRTGIHITQRARNVSINHCHIYNNTGIGIHLDRVNLHQTNITGCHVSYCRLGGIRIEGSEIRNLQITGNDIEYNNNRAHKVPGADDPATAEIYTDVREGTVREGTIASNTIQATYSPNGANIRFVGNPDANNEKGGMWAISGNLIGSQATNIHLTACRGIVIAGNFIYSGQSRNLLVENCREIVVGANGFGHNPDYQTSELCVGVTFRDSVGCSLSGLVLQDSQAGENTVAGAVPASRQATLELIRCRRFTLTGVQVLEGAPNGISLEDCSDTLLSGCLVLDGRPVKKMQSAIRWTGPGAGNLITGCRLGSGTAKAIVAEPHVRLVENLLDDAP